MQLQPLLVAVHAALSTLASAWYVAWRTAQLFPPKQLVGKTAVEPKVADTLDCSVPALKLTVPDALPAEVEMVAAGQLSAIPVLSHILVIFHVPVGSPPQAVNALHASVEPGEPAEPDEPPDPGEPEEPADPDAPAEPDESLALQPDNDPSSSNTAPPTNNEIVFRIYKLPMICEGLTQARNYSCYSIQCN